MRNKENKHLGLEIDPQLHAKLKYVAKYEDRSINGQVLCLIKPQFEAGKENIGNTVGIRCSNREKVLFKLSE